MAAGWNAAHRAVGTALGEERAAEARYLVGRVNIVRHPLAAELRRFEDPFRPGNRQQVKGGKAEVTPCETLRNNQETR
jgi:hypothetical protein